MEGGGRAEEGGGAALGPFVKQSKMVSRGQPEVAPPSAAHGTPDFWDRLVQQPSYLWMEDYQEAPPRLMSGCAAQRPPGEEGAPWPWEAAPPPRSLPTPKELCQRKRKGPKGRRRLRGFSVSYHLEEVKRRQSNIDKQKAAQEGGALAQLSPQRSGTAGDLPVRPWSPARTPEPYARPFLGRGTSAQLLLQPQWNPNRREPRGFPQERPLAFYALAAHHRSPPTGSAQLRPEE